MTGKLNKYGLFFLILSVLATVSCVEQIVPDLNYKDTESVLVVDGTITDETGPFRVKLSRSVMVNVLYSPDPVNDANVSIYDDKGNLYRLYSKNDGWYETDENELKGIPGNSYTLAITTSDGMQYESSTVIMNVVPDIDTLYFDETVRTTFIDDQIADETWLNIRLDSHDQEGKIQYWYFQFMETWKVSLLTENVRVVHSPPGELSNISNVNVLIDNDKRDCWVTRPSNSILIASTVNSPVDELRGFIVRSFGPYNEQLHIGYSILVKQSSISREQYDFWKQLKDVNESTGGLYEKLPSQVFGNITCCDGNAKALGYFAALSVREKRLFISKSDHHVKTQSAYQNCGYYDYEPFYLVPKSFFGINEETGNNVYTSEDFCADCRAYGTNIKPSFWP
jgi:hypothetical protein